MTKEEKIEHTRAYNRAYRKANKEKMALREKLWRKSNKEKVAKYQKEYRIANKESVRKTEKIYRQSLKDGFYTLYYLPEHHYIGITNQPKKRLINHRATGRLTEGYEVVATFDTKREALDAETYMHSIGYVGGNPFIFKKKQKHND